MFYFGVVQSVNKIVQHNPRERKNLALKKRFTFTAQPHNLIKYLGYFLVF